MTRIGIVFPGDPHARGTWSGTPGGLAGGFAELGCDVRRIDARPPRLLETAALGALTAAHLRPGKDARRLVRRARTAARLSPALAAMRSSAANANVRRAGHLDAIVQIGTGYAIPAGLPVATFEDLTIPQAIELGFPGWDILSKRAIASRVSRQRTAYDRATACCLSTPWAATSVVRDYSVPATKVHAVGLGRNHEPSPVERTWSTPRFLFVGLDWEGKNGAGLLRVFARVRERHPDARLDLVGGHPPIEQAGVHGHGVLRMDDPGERARVESLFQSATCFVMPSQYEASAIAYIEAGAAGLPVIGSSAGGSGDLIGDGGCVVAPGDDERLLAAMLDYCDPSVAALVGARALERSRMFTWRAAAERIVRALALPEFADQPLAPFLEPATPRAA